MNYIKKIKIEGFWGDRTVELKLDKNINFLIGSNGSGKTTVINLIAASLRADIETLYNATFSKITIDMLSDVKKNKATIQIIKENNKTNSSTNIRYIISENLKQKIEFIIEDWREDRLYRDPRYLKIRNRNLFPSGAEINKILQNIIKTNWLSIHRNEPERGRHYTRDELQLSSIDQKIEEISQKFSRYFSSLASTVTEKTKNFQEIVFLSLIERQKITEVEEIINHDEKETVVTILRELGVDETSARKSVDNHYKSLESSIKKYKRDKRLLYEDFAPIFNTLRMRDLINQWEKFKSERDIIYNPRTKFVEIINNLLSGKQLEFNERNEPLIFLDSIKGLTQIESLSSGEKQLFILLGETLLQEGQPFLFIADEPELSLHITWQSVLFEKIRELNPASQIICATHSPDIVGNFQDKIIKIEECYVKI